MYKTPEISLSLPKKDGGSGRRHFCLSFNKFRNTDIIVRMTICPPCYQQRRQLCFYRTCYQMLPPNVSKI